MTYYPDLQPCDVLEVNAVGVGWLDTEHEFPVGPVDRDWFLVLVQHLSNAWQPFANAGLHRCPFCRFSHGPAALRFEGHEVALGSSLLLVPGPSALYVAPSLVAHYIDAHSYQPPAEFRAAVAAAPKMRSIAYLKELRRFGVSPR